MVHQRQVSVHALELGVLVLQLAQLEARIRAEGGVWVVDGHRRQAAIGRALKRGAPLPNPKDQQAWIQVVYFEGNDADRTARIITSAANKPLTQIEVAEGYKRLRGFGWSAADIAAKVGKTAEHVQQLLALGIITLGQINEALHFATVNTAQLAELGFQPLDNRAA